MALAYWEVGALMQPGEMPEGTNLLGRPEWMVRGACKSRDGITWFPNVGESAAPATGICRHECPVKNECLAYALANPDLAGIWGGTSARERRRIRASAGFSGRAMRTALD